MYCSSIRTGSLLAHASVVLAVLVAASPISGQREFVAAPDPPGFLARVADESLRLEHLAQEARAASEKDRFDRLYYQGKFRAELFSQIVHSRERWIDEKAWSLAKIRRLSGPAEIQSVLSAPKFVDAQRSEAFDSAMSFIREKLACDIVVPPFRVDMGATTGPVFGSRSAPVTILEYIDFRCAACRMLLPRLKALVNELGGSARLEVRHYALSPQGGEQFELAEGALCANAQRKYWEMAERIFSSYDDTSSARTNLERFAADLDLDLPSFGACMREHMHSNQIISDQEQAADLGVYGAPTVFVNGRRLMGGEPVEAVRKIVQLELSGTNPSQVCAQKY